MVRANNNRAMVLLLRQRKNLLRMMKMMQKRGGGGSFPCFLCEIKGLGLSALYVSFEGKKNSFEKMH